MTQKHGPEEIGESLHRWNAKTGAVETWALGDGWHIIDSTLDWARGGPEWWYVTVAWHLVDGAPMPTGFRVQASDGKQEDQPKAISRDLTKRLPLGEITTQGLEQLIAFHDGVTLALAADDPERRATSAALRTGTPGRMEQAYRRAYALHSKAKASGHRQPSKWTWEQLGLAGITDARGESPSYEVVRTKWIRKGRELVAKDLRSEQRAGTQMNEREE